MGSLRGTISFQMPTFEPKSATSCAWYSVDGARRYTGRTRVQHDWLIARESSHRTRTRRHTLNGYGYKPHRLNRRNVGLPQVMQYPRLDCYYTMKNILHGALINILFVPPLLAGPRKGGGSGGGAMPVSVAKAYSCL